MPPVSLEPIPTQPAARRRVGGRLIVIGHHLVVRHYQELWTSAALEFPELDIRIVCPTRYYEQRLMTSSALDDSLVPVHRLPTAFGRSGRQHLHFYIGLGRLLDRIAPDYVYCAEEPNSLVTAQVARQCTQRRIPYLFWTSLNRLRIYNQMYGRMNVRRYLFSATQSYTFRTAAAANATSDDAESVLRNKGFTGPIVNRPTHGIGDNYLAHGRERLRHPIVDQSVVTIGFLGRLIDWKAVDVLLYALSSMQHRPAVRAVIVGSGPMESEWKGLAAQLQLSDVVTWKPAIHHSAVPQQLSEFDLLVLPSMLRGGINEKFGRVLIEAMAAGVVAVGSRDGGIPGALAGAGLLFTPGNAQELARILDQLCSNARLRRSLQQKGVETAASRYGFRAVAKNLLTSIQDTLGWFSA